MLYYIHLIGSTVYLRLVLVSTTYWFYCQTQTGSTVYHRLVPLPTTGWFHCLLQTGSTVYHRLVLLSTRDWFQFQWLPQSGSTVYCRLVLLSTLDWFYCHLKLVLLPTSDWFCLPQAGSTVYLRLVLLSTTDWFYCLLGMSTNIRISEYSVPDRIFGYCFPNRIFGRKKKEKKASNFKDFVFVKFASNIAKKVVPRVIMFIPVGAIMRRYGDDSKPVINAANKARHFVSKL
ncbi:hypothetical protein DPMN_128294 [Dreissena polymorpha]|uniref:Uncharacterized protein n=1 Tax=Dreissena polymorpha TaxID=45954 RepID=A0A9D4H0J6_DREPO|nr:hypothetical protein DPMN_128294 [Dreissena polymorpha]